MKNTLAFMGPVASRSGYGERSRDLLRSFIKLDQFQITVIPTRWGDTPLNALDEKSDSDILSLIGELKEQPQVFVQVTIPSEFNPIGKFNIGVTAGIETTVCDPSWIEGCNRMNLVLTSSKHSANVFEASKFDVVQNNQVVNSLQIKVPVKVLTEGVNLDIFRKDHTKSPVIEEFFSQVKENFTYLFVGHWLQGDPGHDRKNVSTLIKYFIECFGNKGFKQSHQPALILKTSGGNLSTPDRLKCIEKIQAIKNYTGYKEFPSIYLLHGDLTASEMNALYNHPKVKAHISLTKGEGFGRPLAEAAISGKPIIASGWSGHLDFLNPETSFLINGSLNPVHYSAAWKGVLNQEASWFDVNEKHAKAIIKHVHDNYDSCLEVSRKTTKHIKDNFSMQVMTNQLKEILDEHLPKLPKVIQLPSLDQLKFLTKNEPAKE